MKGPRRVSAFVYLAPLWDYSLTAGVIMAKGTEPCLGPSLTTTSLFEFLMSPHLTKLELY